MFVVCLFRILEFQLNSSCHLLSHPLVFIFNIHPATTFANHLQNFIQHPALKVNSISEGNYRGLSVWLSTQQIDY